MAQPVTCWSSWDCCLAQPLRCALARTGLIESSSAAQPHWRHGIGRRRRALREFGVAEASQVGPAVSLAAKSEEQRLRIRTALMGSSSLGPLLKDAGDRIVQDIVARAILCEVSDGEDLVRQKDDGLESFYVVEEGSFVFLKDGVPVLTQADRGYACGEPDVLYRVPRAFTVRATSASKVWAISRPTLQPALASSTQKRVEAYSQMLSRTELFQDQPEDRRRALADALVELTFQKGEAVFEQGEQGTTAYMLWDGCMSCEMRGKETARLVGDPSKGHAPSFGTRALMRKQKRTMTVRTMSDTALVLAIDQSAFMLVMPDCVNEQDVRTPTPRTIHGTEKSEMSLENFVELGLLGIGGFGRVALVQHVTRRSMFALKSISKGYVSQRNQESCVKSERAIWHSLDGPWFVQLVGTFSSEEYVHFLLEPVLGGDLFSAYAKHPRMYGAEYYARFYVACVGRALAHLHSRHVVYRDLKPENVLLDGDGYCKLTDFSTSRVLVGHAYTVCGTPEYFAPEMLTCAGYTLAVDWWALGVLAYELMTGAAPFAGEDPMATCSNVRAGFSSVPLPSAGAWVDLVLGLGQDSPSERLPMRPRGFQNVERHAWYSEGRCCLPQFDWLALDKRRMQAPYMPYVANDTDLRNFVVDDESPPYAPYVPPEGSDGGQPRAVGTEERYGAD